MKFTGSAETSVTGNVFLAETPETFTYDGDPASPKWLRGTGGRLIAVETLPDLPLDVPVVHVAFDYDYMSRRVGKHVYEWDDATTNWLAQSSSTFIYDSWNMIQEIKLSALSFEPQTNNSWFVWGLDLSGSLSGAGGIGGLLTSVSGTNAVCYTYDANGNVSEMLSALSSELSILAHYEYSPFGETIVATGPLAKENKFRFSTKYTDDETKLVYYGYRFYSPGMGRWLNRDHKNEIGSQSWFRKQKLFNQIELFLSTVNDKDMINIYMFCLNNSTNLYDLLGELSCTVKACKLSAINVKIDSLRALQLLQLIAIGVDLDALLVLYSGQAIATGAYNLAHAAAVTCREAKEYNPCKDCTVQEAFETEMLAELNRVNSNIDLILKRLVELTQGLADIEGKITTLQINYENLQAQRCTWP